MQTVASTADQDVAGFAHSSVLPFTSVTGKTELLAKPATCYKVYWLFPFTFDLYVICEVDYSGTVEHFAHVLSTVLARHVIEDELLAGRVVVAVQRDAVLVPSYVRLRLAGGMACEPYCSTSHQGYVILLHFLFRHEARRLLNYNAQ